MRIETLQSRPGKHNGTRIHTSARSYTRLQMWHTWGDVADVAEAVDGGGDSSSESRTRLARGTKDDVSSRSDPAASHRISMPLCSAILSSGCSTGPASLGGRGRSDVAESMDVAEIFGRGGGGQKWGRPRLAFLATVRRTGPIMPREEKQRLLRILRINANLSCSSPRSLKSFASSPPPTCVSSSSPRYIHLLR